MQKLIAPLIFCFAFFNASAKQDQSVKNPYKNYFDEAYSLYPDIPRGVLEAVSFCNTHFNHITHSANEEGSCTGMPKAYGVMGLILDGQNYFADNLKLISTLSGYTEQEIINSPEKNILAYAKAYNSNREGLNIHASHSISGIGAVLVSLTELPFGTKGQYFALQTQLYGYLSFMNDPKNQTLYNFPNPNFDLANYFGDNYSVLSSSSVTLSEKEVKGKDGSTFKNSGPAVQSPDYAPAIWNPAATCNYSVGRPSAISAVTIHDVEGSYAGAISWFQNCSAVVSAHYVIRSSDGQITQMVLESNKAWHVGSENGYTIGIEHEGYQSQTGWYTTAMYTASANLVKDICNSGYGINPIRVGFQPWMPTTYYNQSSIPGSCCTIKGHQHYPNQTHTDPGPNWDWDYYYKLINTQPAPTSYTASSGNFYDSGGPNNNYSNDERTVWTIAPANATQVTLTFSSFNVENTWDYIYIYDGTDVWAPLIGYWTGTNSPGTVVANSGTMCIEFRSDCATNLSGWNASYTSNSNVVVPTNLSVAPSGCPQLGVNLNWTNSGANWFADVSADPNFTTFYNKAVANVSTVACPGGFCDSPNCTSYLKFRPGTTYYWRIWNGSTHTNGGSFTTPVCASSTVNCSGTFDDTGGPSGPYSGNEDYTYTIAPANASSVTMNFTAFDVEANFDSLYIYNGPTINSPLIGAYTGLNSPGTVTAGSGKMTLHFVSDPFVNNAGWAATWNCSTVSTGLESLQQLSGVTIYPNPANGAADLNYVLGNAGPVQIQLVDMLGRQLKLLNESAQSSGEHTLHIDLNALALSTGIYDVRITSSGANSNIKLIVK